MWWPRELTLSAGRRQEGQATARGMRETRTPHTVAMSAVIDPTSRVFRS